MVRTNGSSTVQDHATQAHTWKQLVDRSCTAQAVAWVPSMAPSNKCTVVAAAAAQTLARTASRILVAARATRGCLFSWVKRDRTRSGAHAPQARPKKI